MKRRPTPLELACGDLVADEQLGRGRSQAARARELLDVLEQVRRRPHAGVAGLVFFELDELPPPTLKERNAAAIAVLDKPLEPDDVDELEPYPDEWIAP